MIDPERRLQLDLRQAVDEHIAQGWAVVNRAPLTLSRGHMWCELRMVGARCAKIGASRPRP